MSEKIDFKNLERPTPKPEFEDEEELNIFTDELPDLNDDIRKEATKVVDNAVSEFMNDLFVDDEAEPEKEINIPIYHSIKQSKILTNKFNQEGERCIH